MRIAFCYATFVRSEKALCIGRFYCWFANSRLSIRRQYEKPSSTAVAADSSTKMLLTLFTDVAKWKIFLRFGVVNLSTDFEEDMVG